jgi:hypothetical protein
MHQSVLGRRLGAEDGVPRGPRERAIGEANQRWGFCLRNDGGTELGIWPVPVWSTVRESPVMILTELVWVN